MLDAQSLRRSFKNLFGREPRLFSAPGRVNLIGEHTDYNDGFVLPMAANRRTYAAAALRTDKTINVHSFELGQSAAFQLDGDRKPHQQSWLTYVQGVAFELEDAGCRLNGADIAVTSELPIGAGLSSSAALELATGYALLKLSDANVHLMKLVFAAQKAEHNYVGTKSGLMDQLTAAFGRKDHAVFIDCRSIHMDLIPMNVHAAVVVCDTNVKHELASSAYNQRREECERAVQLLRKWQPAIKALRDVAIDDVSLTSELPEPLKRRSRHVITENDRTLRAVNMLRDGDVVNLGQLMNQSHVSLRDDYEVSCRELDIMVDLAWKQADVFGARMMGGGFGGCTVNLVRADGVADFSERIMKNYQEATGIAPAIYSIEADGGVHEFTY